MPCAPSKHGSHQDPRQSPDLHLGTRLPEGSQQEADCLCRPLQAPLGTVAQEATAEGRSLLPSRKRGKTAPASSQPARARTRTAGDPEAPSPPPAPSADLGRFWKRLGEESLTGLLGIRLSLLDMPWLGPGGQHPRPPFHGLGPFQASSSRVRGGWGQTERQPNRSRVTRRWAGPERTGTLRPWGAQPHAPSNGG